MDHLLDEAYSIGGGAGVVIAVLVIAVVYLYRAREREHRERLRETRENTKLMTRMLDTAAKRSIPPQPPPSASMPPPGPDWEEDTTLTWVQHQAVRELVIKYIDED